MSQRKVISLTETKRRTLSLREVELLFDSEAVLFGNRNGVPMHRARQLFGEKAVMYVKEFQSTIRDSKEYKVYWNAYTLNKKDFFIAYYLTFDGFKLAATYVNVELTAKAAEEEKT